MKMLKNFSFDQIRFRQIRIFCITITALAMLFILSQGWTVNMEIAMLMAMILNGTGLVFLGSAVREPMIRPARNLLLTGLAACIWLLVLQASFLVVPGISVPKLLLCTVPCEYLMLLPYAALSQEKQDTGLRIMGGIFCLATFLLMVLSVCLVLKIPVPGFGRQMKWHLKNLSVCWLPNMLSSLFMIGIGLKLAFLCGKGRLWMKILAGILILGELLCLALTNCSTVYVAVSLIVGGTVFFLIQQSGRIKKSGVRLGVSVLAGMLAVVILALPLLLSSEKQTELYRENKEYYANQVYADSIPKGETNQEEKTELPVGGLETMHIHQDIPKQGTKNLPGADLLSGRMGIWYATVQIIRDHPGVLLFGTEKIGDYLSQYRGRETFHAHNAWVQVLLRTGLPGLLLSLWVTWLAVRNAFLLLFRRKASLSRKIIGLLVLGILLAQTMEASLFIEEAPNNVINMMFLLLTGYLVHWARVTPPLKEK